MVRIPRAGQGGALEGIAVDLKIFVLLAGVLPHSVIAQDEEEKPWTWRYEDGWITRSELEEAQELREQRLSAQEEKTDAARWNARARTILDTAGQLSKPVWAAQGRPSHWDLQVSGDSSLRSWLCAWKTRHYQVGAGFWNAKTVGIDWPIQLRSGGFLGFQASHLDVRLGLTRDSLAVLSTTWAPAPGYQIGLGYLQKERRTFWTFEPRAHGFRAAFWIPQGGDQAAMKYGVDRLLLPGLKAKIRTFFQQRAPRDSILQLTVRERKTQVSLNSQLTWNKASWTLSLEERYRKPWDSLPEWYMGTKAVRAHSRARIEFQGGVLNPGLGASTAQVRVAAAWSWNEVFPLILGAGQCRFQGSRPPALQLETGLRHSLPRRTRAEILWILPTDYRTTSRARLRSTLSGPILPHQEFQISWSMEGFLGRTPPLCNPKGELLWMFRW